MQNLKRKTHALFSFVFFSSSFYFLLFSWLGCTEDDVAGESLVTGSCSEELSSILDPDTLTLGPGESANVQVIASVKSNCQDVGRGIEVTILDDSGLDITGCNQNGTGNMFACNVAVTIPAEKSPETYVVVLKVSMTDLNKETKTIDDTLIVNVIPQSRPEFSISLSRSNVSIPQGSSDTLKVFVNRSDGHNAAVTLSLYDKPNDVTYSFDRNPVTAEGNSSLLSLRADQNASLTAGTPVRVVGNDGTSEEGAYFSLAITAYVNPWQGGFSGFSTLSGVHFTDVDHGVAVGWSGTVIRTENGGSVWNQLDAGTSEYLNAVQFTDAMTGFIAGDHNTFLFTSNGGASWVDTLGIDNVNTDFNGIYFLSAQEGWVVGTIIGYTTNGGQNWDIQLESQAGRIFNEIAFGSPSNGVAVGRKSSSEGVIFYTRDGGAHWYESTYPGATIPWMNDVCFVNSSTAYAVGTHGTIVKSTNGGESWSQLVSNTNDNLFGVSFGDENNGWAVSSQIIHTNDAGQTWSEEITLTRTANDVYFLNSRTGYAVGESGIIFRRF